MTTQGNDQRPDDDAPATDAIIDGNPLPEKDTSPLSTPEEYQDALTEAIESNDLGKMAQFIGSLPPAQEEMFRQLRAQADAENRAFLGGLIGMVTGMPVQTNAAPSNFLDSLLEGGIRMSNHQPESQADKEKSAKVLPPRPIQSFEL